MQVFRHIFKKKQPTLPREKNKQLHVTLRSICRNFIMSSESFHKKILPLRDKLFRLAYSIVKEQAEAEDVLQDVLTQLWS